MIAKIRLINSVFEYFAFASSDILHKIENYHPLAVKVERAQWNDFDRADWNDLDGWVVYWKQVAVMCPNTW